VPLLNESAEHIVQYQEHVRSEVLIAPTMKSSAFWDITP
jgi:hypothetical protein